MNKLKNIRKFIVFIFNDYCEAYKISTVFIFDNFCEGNKTLGDTLFIGNKYLSLGFRVEKFKT